MHLDPDVRFHHAVRDGSREPSSARAPSDTITLQRLGPSVYCTLVSTLLGTPPTLAAGGIAAVDDRPIDIGQARS
jgi:hypothetical protein